MRLDRTRPSLCYVDDRRAGDSPRRLWGLGDEVWSQVDIVQVRGKGLPAGDLETLVEGWVERLSGLPTAVVVNNRVDIAVATGADGTHLGRDDFPVEAARAIAPQGFLLGVSTHGREQLLAAEVAGADYAGLGAFRASRTKPDAKALEPDRAGLTEPFPELTIPVLAIGGLDAGRVADAFRVPAVTGVAVGAAVTAAADPQEAIRGLRAALEAAWLERAVS